MVDTDSADVWVRQDDFDLDVSVGVPPDAFSATGQDWGMPLYRWDHIGANDFTWLRQRARTDREPVRRLPHRSPGGLLSDLRAPAKWRRAVLHAARPNGQQLSLGERLLDVFRSAGAEVIAEDLGVVPDFVRASLDRLGVPGFRVFRWERHWKDAGTALQGSGRVSGGLGRHLGDTRYRNARGLVGPGPRRRPPARRPSSERREAHGRRRPVPTDVRPDNTRRHRRIAAGLGVEPGAARHPGRVRLAGPDQRAGDGLPRQLDVPAAVASRSSDGIRRGVRTAAGAAELGDRT